MEKVKLSRHPVEDQIEILTPEEAKELHDYLLDGLIKIVNIKVEPTKGNPNITTVYPGAGKRVGTCVTSLDLIKDELRESDVYGQSHGLHDSILED